MSPEEDLDMTGHVLYLHKAGAPGTCHVHLHGKGPEGIREG
jgi:hypothetical protein